jgi:hypothetical protein
MAGGHSRMCGVEGLHIGPHPHEICTMLAQSTYPLPVPQLVPVSKRVVEEQVICGHRSFFLGSNWS